MEQRVIGGYEVVGEIGRGGMGVVYLARQPSLDRLVALKLLMADDERMAQRLELEARRLADLQHPNIVTVLDVGRDQDEPWYAMTYCAGGTLSSVLERDGRLTPGQAAGVLAAMADALAAVHARGLVHRDVKPSNVFLSSEGRPYLGDLGIAVEGGLDRPTTTMAVLGTIGYTAPEVIAGGALTPAADVFGLGVMGYQLLSGTQPFQGAHIAAVIDAVRSGRFEPLAGVVEGADPQLVALVEQAMAIDPLARPADLRLWGQAVAAAVPHETITPVVRPDVTGATIAPSRLRERAGAAPAPEPAPRRKGPVLVAAGVAALVVAAGAAFALSGGGGDSDAPITAPKPVSESSEQPAAGPTSAGPSTGQSVPPTTGGAVVVPGGGVVTGGGQTTTSNGGGTTTNGGGTTTTDGGATVTDPGDPVRPPTTSPTKPPSEPTKPPSEPTKPPSEPTKPPSEPTTEPPAPQPTQPPPNAGPNAGDDRLPGSGSYRLPSTGRMCVGPTGAPTANDSDPNGDVLSYAITARFISDGGAGSGQQSFGNNPDGTYVEMSGSGAITFCMHSNTFKNAYASTPTRYMSIHYRISDGRGGTDDAIITIWMAHP